MVSRWHPKRILYPKSAFTVSFVLKTSVEPAGVSLSHSSIRVLPSLPVTNVMLYVPLVRMGADNFTFIIFANPLLQTPCAPETVTAVVPVTIKSVPSVAMLLH